MSREIFTAVFGVVGCALSFNLSRKHIIPATLGGFGTAFLYAIISNLTANVFIINFISTLFTAVYSEIYARRQKAPAILFLLPSVIPILPGSYLYYTMECLANADIKSAFNYGSMALWTSLGIGFGLIFVYVIIYQFRRIF